MKRATKRIIEKFPQIKGKLKAYENIDLVREALKVTCEYFNPFGLWQLAFESF